MKKHYSVVVIGGGPGGSAAAYTLAKQGIDVCIIDKSIFPRDKLCGGLLTLRSKKIFTQIFDADWENTYEYKTNTINFFYKSQFLNSAENYGEVFLTYRHYFDHYLLTLAKEKGVFLYTGQSVKSIDLENKFCTLSSGEKISYKFLIGADGVNSLVAKTLFGQAFNKKTIGFALEMEVAQSAIKRDVTAPEIYMGVSHFGYAWVFPKRDYLTIGIVGIQRKNPDLKASFSTFLTDCFGEIPNAKIKGFPIPFGDYRKTLGHQQVLLVGDAAGFADPMSGEGIAYAMQSGYFAALAIADSNVSKQDVIKIYTAKCAEISHSFAYAKWLSYSLFHPLGQKLYVRLLPRKNNLPLRHMDVLADQMSYSQYMKCVIIAILELIPIPFFRH